MVHSNLHYVPITAEVNFFLINYSLILYLVTAFIVLTKLTYSFIFSPLITALILFLLKPEPRCFFFIQDAKCVKQNITGTVFKCRPRTLCPTSKFL